MLFSLDAFNYYYFGPVVGELGHPWQCEMIVVGYLAAPAGPCLLVRAGWKTV